MSILLRYRRGLDFIATKKSFEDNFGAKTSSPTTFEVYDIVRTGQVLDNIQVVGYCKGSFVYPKCITYTINPNK